MRHKSKQAFQKARRYIPGGVNSPARALRGVGATPVFMQKAHGPHIYDIDHNRYVDFCLSWGVHILGHNHPVVINAVKKALACGTSFGTATEMETELAELIVNSVPSIEKVRFVNSGTEAAMSAIRLARGYTGKKILVKFDGAYHGHVDGLLVAAGSGVMGLPQSSSAGIPSEMVSQTVSLPFNDFGAVTKLFKKIGNKIAAVIVEPVPANMGVVLPRAGFLQFLREITEKYGALLIFDEVITGFRIGLAGAQGYFKVEPDLTILGKIIGGGFPVGAFGGRKKIMDRLAPGGDVYQAGTLSGNPVAMAAGVATLLQLRRPDFYAELNQKAEFFLGKIRDRACANGWRLNALGSMFTLFFSQLPVEDFATAQKCDIKKFGNFYRKLLGRGIYFSPSQFEANFISAAQTKKQLSAAAEVIGKSL